MGAIQQLAADLGAEERTLRRAVVQGTIHCRRQGPRRTKLAADEADYLREHWELLLDLRKALRTEREVRLAVLYGSVARGHEDAGSDLDVLVALSNDRVAADLRAGGALGTRRRPRRGCRAPGQNRGKRTAPT